MLSFTFVDIKDESRRAVCDAISEDTTRATTPHRVRCLASLRWHSYRCLSQALQFGEISHSPIRPYGCRTPQLGNFQQRFYG